VCLPLPLLLLLLLLLVWCFVCSPAPASVGDKVTSALNTAKADAAATAIVNAGRRGRGSAVAAAAADSLVDQASKGKTSSVAEAFAVSAARDATAFAAVLAKAASGARSRGTVQSFAKGCVSTSTDCRLVLPEALLITDTGPAPRCSLWHEFPKQLAAVGTVAVHMVKLSEWFFLQAACTC